MSSDPNKKNHQAKHLHNDNKDPKHTKGRHKKRFKPSKTLSGVLLMLLHAIFMAFIYFIVKKLTNDLHPNQITFLYKFTVLLLVIPWCIAGGFKKNIKTNKLGLHVARGTFSVMGSLCFFYSISKLQLIEAAVITKLEQVIVVLIGILYFKERFTHAKCIMIILCVLGVLFVTKPGFEPFNKNYIFIFLAIMFWAANNFSIKVLGKTERTKAQIFYVMLVSSILSLPLAVANWVPLNSTCILYIILLSVCNIIHLAAFFRAYKLADISLVMPFDYTRLVFTGILGYFLLNEVPDKWSLVGYILIASGGLYLIFHETKKKGLTREAEEKLVSEQ